MLVSIIAAIGKNRELGKNNKLLWQIPDDLKHFRKITSGHTVIMGRKTFESIGKLLPNRTNIIVTRNPDYKVPGTIIAGSLEKAIAMAKNNSESEAFVIGGGQIYREAIQYADKLYLTVIDANKDADTFFPDYSSFSKVTFEEHHQQGEIHFVFWELEK